ncbi:hypothetical protein [Stieleria varia]|nr:hypothetical protein [Stieleria varia]
MQPQQAVASQLSFTRLSRSGYYYCDRYLLVEDVRAWQLDFVAIPWFRLLGYSLLIGTLFLLFGFAAIELNSEPIPWGVIVLGSVIIPAPFYFPIIRRAATRRYRPFLLYSKNTASICLFGGKQTIPLDDVHAVVDATFSDDDGDSVSEIQLSIANGNGLTSLCLVSTLGGAESDLRQVAQGIADAINRPHITFDDRVRIRREMGEPADARESPS